MKSVFITFDQAFFERIMALLDRQGCRGFSYWQQDNFFSIINC